MTECSLFCAWTDGRRAGDRRTEFASFVEGRDTGTTSPSRFDDTCGPCSILLRATVPDLDAGGGLGDGCRCGWDELGRWAVGGGSPRIGRALPAQTRPQCHRRRRSRAEGSTVSVSLSLSLSFARSFFLSFFLSFSVFFVHAAVVAAARDSDPAANI